MQFLFFPLLLTLFWCSIHAADRSQSETLPYLLDNGSPNRRLTNYHTWRYQQRNVYNEQENDQEDIEHALLDFVYAPRRRLRFQPSRHLQLPEQKQEYLISDQTRSLNVHNPILHQFLTDLFMAVYHGANDEQIHCLLGKDITRLIYKSASPNNVYSNKKFKQLVSRPHLSNKTSRKRTRHSSDKKNKIVLHPAKNRSGKGNKSITIRNRKPSSKRKLIQIHKQKLVRKQKPVRKQKLVRKQKPVRKQKLVRKQKPVRKRIQEEQEQEQEQDQDQEQEQDQDQEQEHNTPEIDQALGSNSDEINEIQSSSTSTPTQSRPTTKRREQNPKRKNTRKPVIPNKNKRIKGKHDRRTNNHHKNKSRFKSSGSHTKRSFNKRGKINSFISDKVVGTYNKTKGKLNNFIHNTIKMSKQKLKGKKNKVKHVLGSLGATIGIGHGKGYIAQAADKVKHKVKGPGGKILGGLIKGSGMLLGASAHHEYDSLNDELYFV